LPGVVIKDGCDTHAKSMKIGKTQSAKNHNAK
jgi:hypothetical protein